MIKTETYVGKRKPPRTYKETVIREGRTTHVIREPIKRKATS